MGRLVVAAFVSVFLQPSFAQADLSGVWSFEGYRCSSKAAYTPDEMTIDSMTLMIDSQFMSFEISFGKSGCTIKTARYAYSIKNQEIVPNDPVTSVDVICANEVSKSTVSVLSFPFQLNEPKLAVALQANGCPTGNAVFGDFVRQQ